MAQLPISSSIDGVSTETIEETDGTSQATSSQNALPLQLQLAHPRDERRVGFHDGVIDNEHMNRKKSKCCCIYKKPLTFGESSSEEDDECEHCFGHPEKRKKNRKPADNTPCPLPRQSEQPSTSDEAQSQFRQDVSEVVAIEVPAHIKDNLKSTVNPSI